MELAIGCPSCGKANPHEVPAHPCTLRCPEPDCRAVFEYAGHCHLFLDIYAQAVRLREDGYPTPSFILSFVCLELYLEWFLVRKMLHDGWGRREIRATLRRHQGITVRAGSLFRRVYGRSLADVLAEGGRAGPRLSASLHRFREARNRAVHEGYQVSDAECREALELTRSIYEVLVRTAAREGVLSRRRPGHRGGRGRQRAEASPPRRGRGRPLPLRLEARGDGR